MDGVGKVTGVEVEDGQAHLVDDGSYGGRAFTLIELFRIVKEAIQMREEERMMAGT